MAERFLGTWLSQRNPPKIRSLWIKWGYTYVGRGDSMPPCTSEDLSQSRRCGDRLPRAVRCSAIASRCTRFTRRRSESQVLEDLDVLRELLRLRSDGLVIGLTVNGTKQADVIRRALRVEVDGLNPFQVVQATWNLLERSAEAALAEAKARGWGVIVKEALANGRLTDEAGGEHLTELRKAAVSRGATLDAVALAAALAQPWADVVLSGAVTIDQLESNLKAVVLARQPMNWPDVTQSPGDYWSQRSALPWR